MPGGAALAGAESKFGKVFRSAASAVNPPLPAHTTTAAVVTAEVMSSAAAAAVNAGVSAGLW